MPLFEFECKSCNHRFEELVLSSSKTVERCPKCEESNVKKLVSAGSIKTGGDFSASAPAPACSPGG
jgi:putative FmdB family regulatory protein